jgi:glycosyltransferase involved in cell wall biosynthesis
MPKDTVTVIIPTYNRSWGLKRAVESVLAQTYSHFKVIVMDDCSTDDTEEIARSFNDSRIEYCRQSHNEGIGRNWGKGLQLSRTPYVCFLMDDDYYDSSFLQNRVELLEQHPDALLVFSGYRRVNADGLFLAQIGPKCDPGRSYDGFSLLRIFLLEGGVFVGSMMYRFDPLSRLWAENERYDLIIDYALNLSLALLPSGRGVFCDAVDFNMSSHAGQTFHTSNIRVHKLVELVLRENLARVSGEHLAVLRRAYVNSLTDWALAEARNDRRSAVRLLAQAAFSSSRSTRLWRRWGYTFLVILGVKD